MPSTDNGLPPAYSPDHVLVQFQAGQAASLKALFLPVDITASEVITPADATQQVARLTLAPGVTVEQAISALSNAPGVASAEPDWLIHLDTLSNDAAVLAGKTWGLYGDAGSLINPYGSNAISAWADGYTGSTKVAVGVVDSGIDYTHPDLYLNVWLNQREIPAAFRSALKDTDGDGLITFRDLNDSRNASWVSDRNGNGRIDAGDLLKDPRWANGADDDGNGYKDDLVGWDFANNDNDPMDDQGHGTHVSGTIGAAGGNGVGVAGVAWTTQILPMKFLDASGGGLTSNAIRALDYITAAAKAASGVDVVATNNSWGGAGYSGALLSAITRGAQAQILYVAAAGNSAHDNDATPYYPSSYSTVAGAGYEAVISVAALNRTGGLASFSDWGDKSVDLAAPGDTIYSTTRGGGYGYMSGTSMATPHVTGAIALYASAAPGLSAAAIRADLLAATLRTDSLVGKVATDSRLDVGALLGDVSASGGGVTVTGAAGGDLISPLASVAGQPRPTGGDDTLSGMAGNDTLDGGAGADRLVGGAGNDVYIVDNVNDRVVETLAGTEGGTSDRVLASVSYTLPANVERLNLIGTADLKGAGNGLDNIIYGNSGDNRLSGLGGDDMLFGGGGDDVLAGGPGADRLTGGAGADRFILAQGEAAGDVIVDFAPGDQIQLTGYAPGSTLRAVSGSHTDWVIRDAGGAGTEIIHLANGYSLTAADFVFV